MDDHIETFVNGWSEGGNLRSVGKSDVMKKPIKMKEQYPNDMGCLVLDTMKRRT